MVQARSTTFVGCQQDSKTLILPHHDVHYLWLCTAQRRFPWSESGGASGHASARVQSLSRSSPGGALGFVLSQMDVVMLRAVQGRHHHHERGHQRSPRRAHALLRPGGLGFMLYKESEAPLRAVQSELHYHDRGH